MTTLTDIRVRVGLDAPAPRVQKRVHRASVPVPAVPVVRPLVTTAVTAVHVSDVEKAVEQLAELHEREAILRVAERLVRTRENGAEYWNTDDIAKALGLPLGPETDERIVRQLETLNAYGVL